MGATPAQMAAVFGPAPLLVLFCGWDAIFIGMMVVPSWNRRSRFDAECQKLCDGLAWLTSPGGRE